MAAGELKTKLTIEASSKGVEDIIKLQREVGKLGESAGTASPEFEALGKELQELARQQALIDQFERLKKAAQDTAESQAQLQQQTRAAALALKEKQAALAQVTAAEQASSSALVQAKGQQEELNQAVKAAKEELRGLKQAAKESGDSSAIMAARIADSEAQLGALKTEARAAGENVKLLNAAHKENVAETRNAATAATTAQRAFDGTRQAASDTKTALDGQQQALQQTRDELGKVGISSTSLAKGQVELRQNLDNARAGMERLAAEAEAAAAIMSDRELLGVKAHADIQKEIDETRAAYERLKASGSLTNAELAQAAMKTEDRVRELQQQTHGWTESLGKAKTAFAGLLASGAGIAAVVNEAIKFESAMGDVAKVADGTSEQMATLATRIKQMTAEIPMAADELAAMAAAGGQLGIPIELLEHFVVLSAKMATAFNISADEAGQAVAKLKNVFSLSLTEVERLGDAINTLGNTTSAKEADILEVLTRIGGTATQFGLAADQAAALGTGMLSLGMSSEVAATAINGMLTKLQTANLQGKDFQAALDGMGLSAQKLAADIREKPQQALLDFLHTLDRLDGQAKAETLVRLFGLEYQDKVARLLQGLKGYEQALSDISDQSKVTGAMQKEFEVRLEGAEAQLKIMREGVRTLAINLGSILLPAITPVITALGDATHALADFVKKFPAVAALAGTVVTVTASIAAMRTAWLAMAVVGTKAVADLTGAMPGMQKQMGDLVAESGRLKTALGALAAAGGAFVVGWEIGSYMREQFLVVELAGIRLAQAIVTQAEVMRTAWEVTKAVFTDDTMEAAAERGKQRLTETSAIFAQMVEDAKAAKKQQVDTANAATSATEAQTGAIREQTAAIKEQEDTRQQAAAKAKDALDKVAAALESLGVSSAAALGKISPDAQSAIDAVSDLEASLQEAGVVGAGVGRTLEMAMLAAVPKADSLEAVAALDAKLREMAAGGDVSAASMGRIQAALLEQRKELQQQIPLAAEVGLAWVDESQKMTVALQEARDAAAARFLEISTSATATGAQVKQAYDDMTAAGRALVEHQSRAGGEIAASHRQMADEVGAALKEAAAAARQRFLELRDSGTATEADIKLAFGEMTTAVAAYEAHAVRGHGNVQVAAEKSAAAIALESRERTQELQIQAQALTSEAELLRYKAKMAQARGDHHTAMQLENEAAQKQLQVEKLLLDVRLLELDAQEKKLRKDMDELKQAGQINTEKYRQLELDLQLNEAQGRAADSTRELLSLKTREMEVMVNAGDAAQSAGRKTADAMDAAAASVQDLSNKTRALNDIHLKELASWSDSAGKKMESTWLSATALASEYGQEAAAAAYASIGPFGTWVQSMNSTIDTWDGFFRKQEAHIALLRRTSDEYVRQMDLLDEQQRKLESSNSGAAAGLAGLQVRLLELEGSEAQIAAAKRAREKAEITSQQALLRIEMQRAELRKDGGEVTRIRAEIAAYDEQLRVLGQIYAAEERNAKAAAAAAKAQEQSAAAAAKATQQQKAAEAAATQAASAAKATASATSSKATTATTTTQGDRKLGSSNAMNAQSSITLNINGVTDPVKLANMLETELAKRQRLSR